MNTPRLISLCVLLSLFFGGVGAWIVGSVYPNVMAQYKVGTNVDPKNASTIVNLIEEESATIHVVNEVTPAVVSVVARKSRADVVKTFRQQSFDAPAFFFDETLTDEEASKMVDVSSGTGFFVTRDGLILTNRHVIDTPGAVFFIITNEGKEFPATLVDTDTVLDIALLRVEGTEFRAVTLADSDTIRIGQTVIAIGNTLSEFRNTVTKGVVSGMNRRVTAGFNLGGSEVIEKAIQTDAAINPGNSGGPLINLLGEVIGINTAVSIDGQAVGFAIPINQVKRAIEDVKTLGHIARPWIGVRYVFMTGETATPPFVFGAKLTSGKSLSETAVIKDGPADVAGLKENDILIAVDGVEFEQGKALAELVSLHRSGDKIQVRYIRDGKIAETTVVLGEAKKD
ncbi:hypothetical protein A2318_02690 [Candidatus Uhrbacteria bacterium RIFOXYB2_FULL_45_11]|uniref:PDZ domain-containing protein n=1 Tax=Candidatus Uhrbacteria bacterium RIFOXYB2_FULL_45_11 TaxID=1802421 RepID=A0A1F7W3M4_9BACT|nr:MAG: hypothetical protein A2318_02690 [Candidatus Uhrbacteria bacterium RIFOXYB2_FULL_45_11]